VSEKAKEAKCMVRVGQLFLQKYAQADEDRTYALPHINLYLSTRQERSYQYAPP